MKRSIWVIVVLLGSLVLFSTAWVQAGEPIKIGVAAMISPKPTVKYYGQLLEWVGKQLGEPIEMVQQEDYSKMDELLKKGKVNIAFICSGPYVKNNAEFGVELLVAPQSYGQPFYYAYIIVPSGSQDKSMADLRGKKFAFTHAKSNTGCLVPTYMVAKQFNQSPDEFFKEYIYTRTHDKSIEAVAKKMVDGASIDSLIYDYAAATNPIYTSKTKIIVKSPPYGIPPVVVTKNLAPDLKQKLKDIFLRMHEDPAGRAILEGIKVDRFVVPKDKDYDSVREMADWVSKMNK